MSRRLLLLLAVTACADPAPEDEVHVTGPCEAPVPWADLADKVRETSGVAASREHPGLFWTHNDSGGDSAVFAIDSTGAVLAHVRVRGATNRDWEDIAVGPCAPGEPGQCLFVGDIGDNRERRETVVIFRIPEPDPFRDTVSATADRFEASYPDGARDAEALLVTDAGLGIITKGRSQSIELYRLTPPFRSGRTTTLERVQELAPPPSSISAQVTGAAASDDGSLIAIRTYSGLRFLVPSADSLRFIGDPADFLGPAQPLGEGIDFIGPDRLVLTGEAGGRRPATIATVRCTPHAAPAPSDSVPSDG